MHVRINIATGGTDVDGAVRFVEERVLPMVREQRGFAGLTVAGDRATSTLSILTLWETEADREASESLAEKARGEAMDVFGGEMHVERYEQVVFDTGDEPPLPGARVHIREIKMDPARVDEHAAFFKETVLPDMKSTPGFRGVRSLVDRATGVGRVGSVWADAASLAAQLERSSERRAIAGERGVEFGEDHEMEVLLVAM